MAYARASGLCAWSILSARHVQGLCYVCVMRARRKTRARNAQKRQPLDHSRIIDITSWAHECPTPDRESCK